MSDYILFDEDGKQLESMFAEERPESDEGEWFDAPEGYDNTRLCVLEDGKVRLITDKEFKEELDKEAKNTLKEDVKHKSDEVRHVIAKGTTSIQREGWHIKAAIAHMWRIENTLQEKGTLKKGERLLNKAEIGAVQAEAKERNKNETETQILQLWELRSARFAQAVCLIDGVSSNAQNVIESSKAEDLEKVAELLLKAAEQKKKELQAAFSK